MYLKYQIVWILNVPFMLPIVARIYSTNIAHCAKGAGVVIHDGASDNHNGQYDIGCCIGCREEALSDAAAILRREAETAHVNTAELLLKLAREIEES